MQAITIKYLPATNTKGSRWKATAAAGSITLGYDHALNSEGNVKAAVKALVKKLAWDRADTWHIGGTPDGHWVAVCASHWSRV
ncbi:hypothetical protein [Pseudomonas antarctica]|uniref:hypothetical protein n=1 Tax=Pseudomonas antarctica TaxID=219572 RepID=UPI00387AD1AF